MKRTLMGAVAGLVAGAVAMWFYLAPHNPKSHSAEEGEHAKAEHPEPRASNEVKLEAAQQARAGVKTAACEAAEWKAWVFGYGRVLDPAPLVTGLLDVNIAQAAAAASAQEFARTQALFDQGQNASRQAVETTEALMQRDRLMAESARSRLGSWGGPSLAGRADLVTLGRSLGALESALIRIDLLPGQTWTPPGAIRVASLANPTLMTEAEWIGPAPTVDATMQGVGILLLLRTNVPAIGTAMLGQFAGGGVAEKGWRIPDAAVVRHLGAMWFYTQKGEGEFERRLLSSGRRLADGWFVAEGITAADRLVVQGAQVLLSEQLKGSAEEE